MNVGLVDIAKDLLESLDELGALLVEELRKELKGQDHFATGRLDKSISHKVGKFVSGLELQVSYLAYGRFMETGAKVRFPYARKRINALMKWIRFKRLTSGLDKDVRGMAFGIATKHKKYGFPIPINKRRSHRPPNGRILQFQTQVLEDNAKRIDDTLTDEVGNKVSATLENMIDRIIKTFT